MIFPGLAVLEKISRNPVLAPIALVVLLLVELGLISVLFRNTTDFNCGRTGFVNFCWAFSHNPLRGGLMMLVVVMFLIARPSLVGRLTDGMRLSLPWAGVHVAGVLLIATQLHNVHNGLTDAAFLRLIGLLSIGGALAAIGALLMVFSPHSIAGMFRAAGPLLPIALLVAAIAPEWGRLIQGSWEWEALTTATFLLVGQFLTWLGYAPILDVHTKLIETRDFAVLVGGQCSGIEGFALITLYLMIFVALFNQSLRPGRVWLLFVIGILASWFFNVVRIVVLVSIGAEGNPDLAVNGFHSHAGWVFFTSIAILISVTALRMPFFRRDGGRNDVPAFADDPMVAEVMPFLVLTGTMMLASSLSSTPAILYPARIAAVAVVMALLWRHIRPLIKAPTLIATVAGIGIGLVWLLAQPRGGGVPDGVAELSALGFAVWALVRVIGTVAIVPIAEELFFRKFAIEVFTRRSPALLIPGIIVSSALFGMMHSRFWLAVAAGLIFAALAVRRKDGVSDAIWAHAIANGLIAAYALVMRDWSVI